MYVRTYGLCGLGGLSGLCRQYLFRAHKPPTPPATPRPARQYVCVFVYVRLYLCMFVYMSGIGDLGGVGGLGGLDHSRRRRRARMRRGGGGGGERRRRKHHLDLPIDLVHQCHLEHISHFVCMDVCPYACLYVCKYVSI